MAAISSYSTEVRLPTTCILVVLALFPSSMPLAYAAKPTWANKAVSFAEKCTSYFPGGYQPCKPVHIPSPDGKRSVEVSYEKVSEGTDDYVLQAYLLVRTPDGTRKAVLPDGIQKNDLLWSPDSKAFFVNGGDGGAYWGFWVYVYLTDDRQLQPIDVTPDASRDMVKTFPPCKAAAPNSKSCNLDPKTCHIADDEYNMQNEYNMTGIDWASPSTILVMAEVPCSTSRGGIMCQVMGYELEVPTGRIRRRVDAKQLKLHWQKSMAWNFRVPEPPLYCE